MEIAEENANRVHAQLASMQVLSDCLAVSSYLCAADFAVIAADSPTVLLLCGRALAACCCFGWCLLLSVCCGCLLVT